MGMSRSVFALLLALCLNACATVRAAVSMRLHLAPDCPADASVKIDEQFIGVLGYVAAKGVRLPEGTHRITIEREGYFPWDRIVVSDREPIHLQVKLQPLPD
jgi:PEGA domain